MKEKLNELLQALINGNNKEAKKALHEYLTSKSRSVLSEMGEYEEDEYDEEMGDEEGYSDEDVDVDLDIDADIDREGDEGGEDDIELRLTDVEHRLDDVEGGEGEGEGDYDEEVGGEERDVDVDLDIDADVDRDREFGEEQETLVRKGRRRDKASKGRLRK